CPCSLLLDGQSTKQTLSFRRVERRGICFFCKVYESREPSRQSTAFFSKLLKINTENLGLSNLRNKLLRNRERPSKPKCPRRNFQPRSRLFALVFVAVHPQRNLLHQLQIESVMLCNLVRAAQVLDIGFQNAVQHVVGR